MMSMLRNALGALWLALVAMAGIIPANAQNAIQAMAVTTCGTPNVTLTNGKNGPVFQDTTGKLCGNYTVTPSAAAGAGIAPAPSAPALATSQVIKSGAGNLYSFEVSADSTLSAAAWWIMIFDATADPGNGAVTPRKCFGQVSGATSAAYAFSTPIAFTTGITIVVSTTGCYTETQSAHAFISGDAK